MQHFFRENISFFKIIKDATLQFISAEDKTTKKLLDDTLEEVKIIKKLYEVL